MFYATSLWPVSQHKTGGRGEGGGAKGADNLDELRVRNRHHSMVQVSWHSTDCSQSQAPAQGRSHAWGHCIAHLLVPVTKTLPFIDQNMQRRRVSQPLARPAASCQRTLP